MNNENAVVILSALAQETRFAVFRLLMKCGNSEMAAGSIAKELGVADNSLSSHLNILSNAGVISSRRDGRFLYYSVSIDLTKDFIGYLINDCCDGQPEICDLIK
ncbi:ArsR/SmtB family transcription factor [Pseudemcibacter aquimaris]|uniref:ArsR/SmtB family transcription factor n=1 Tax=Pseudemcibacter aquimaris TaxID=2857064 RepID=UPI002012BF46|nr:metalloregulator ArsR/SmtB family transcription factor [Pseudemcibacter aquimaris]MCC3862495.1 metalloregulator ArsR/SmtB family transcription factor [Pseudemcibacter aquimaris]WDU57757.1 metalloregulator ArsR/SmtB family transcription factor [Pseudemcibacter aquimaris]